MGSFTQESITSKLQSLRYKDVERTRDDMLATMKHFRGLVPRPGYYAFGDGKKLDLLSLEGTIPVIVKGIEYNIPVCVWVLDSHPYDAPVCYVKPTSDMMIRTSKNVDHHGRVYLPYLHDWQHSSSDLVSLIQVMITVFGETPPVYAVPKGGGAVYTPYPQSSFPSPLRMPQPTTFAGPTPYPMPNLSNHSPYTVTNQSELSNVYSNEPATIGRVKNEDPDGIYPMTPGKIGRCLIINNVDFQHEDFQQREGSDIDAARFEDLFIGFGFRVTVKRNLTAQKMRSAIWDVARIEDNKDCSAFVLIVLTHGDEGLLCGTDYKPEEDSSEQKSVTCYTAVTYKEIVRLLDNNNSRYLRNKPKICFIQACNGVKKSEIAEEGNVGPSSKKYVTTRLPEASDILLSFAAQEGFSTFRRVETGGIYAYHLAKVLEEHAADCDLQEMLGMVERRIRSDIIKVFDKEKQKKVEVCLSTSVKLLGWSRKFYFHSEENQAS